MSRGVLYHEKIHWRKKKAQQIMAWIKILLR